jgi:nitrate reductase NapAB chaperone NapD
VSRETAMPVTIQSYVVQPAAGREAEAAEALAAIPGCEVLPAKNRPVLVLVTETADREAQRELERRIESVDGIGQIALVSGWTEDAEGATEQS